MEKKNKEINQSNGIFDLIRSATPSEHKNSFFHQCTDDDSFELIESLCDMIENEDGPNFFNIEKIPDFQNSLEEVDFILEMSEKIKQQKKSKEKLEINDGATKISHSNNSNTSTPIASIKKNSSLSAKNSPSGYLSPIFVFTTHNYEVTPQKRNQNQTSFLSISDYKKSHQIINCNNKSPLLNRPKKF